MEENKVKKAGSSLLPIVDAVNRVEATAHIISQRSPTFLNHEQIAFLRETLENRQQEALAESIRNVTNPMVSAYYDSVVEDAKLLLDIISPCASIKVDII